MLEVNFYLWFTCNCQLLKDVAVNSRRIFFVPSGILSNWSCMCRLFLKWQVVASIFLKILYMHNKPLTNLFKKEKKYKTFIIFFHVVPTRSRWCFIAISSCWCNCLWAVTILLIFSKLYIVTISWESNNLTLWHLWKLSIQIYYVWSMIPTN
jgi:hypothetical protein